MISDDLVAPYVVGIHSIDLYLTPDRGGIPFLSVRVHFLSVGCFLAWFNLFSCCGPGRLFNEASIVFHLFSRRRFPFLDLFLLSRDSCPKIQPKYQEREQG